VCTIFPDLLALLLACQSLQGVSSVQWKDGVPVFKKSFAQSMRSQILYHKNKELADMATACVASDRTTYEDTLFVYSQQRLVAAVLEERAMPTGSSLERR